MDDYLRMGETIAIECLLNFCRIFIHYLYLFIRYVIWLVMVYQKFALLLPKYRDIAALVTCFKKKKKNLYGSFSPFDYLKFKH